MKSPKLFTKTGGKSTASVTLPKTVFDQKPESHELLKQAYVSYLANGRKNLAVTKERGEVRGGGRKPHQQKGTGRARAGSIRSPIWRGGGITFGPTGEENYAKKLHKKAKRKAVAQALSVALDQGQVSIIDSIDIKNGKTAEFTSLQKKLGLQGKLLVVVDVPSEKLIRATQNIRDVLVVRAKYLNVFDILNTDQILLEKTTLDVLSDWLGGVK